MNEAETRAEHIDPALKAAGWGVVEGSRILREYPITPPPPAAPPSPYAVVVHLATCLPVGRLPMANSQLILSRRSRR